MMKFPFFRILLTTTCSLFLFFGACTQGKDTEEIGKGVTSEGDACEGSQANNVLCKWVIEKFEVDVDLPAPQPDVHVDLRFQVNDQGKITKLSGEGTAGNIKEPVPGITRSYNSQGLLETERASADKDETTKTFEYDSQGNISKITEVKITSDPASFYFALSPRTAIYDYDYSPSPPHHIFITMEEKDKNDAIILTRETGIIHNPEGKPESMEVISFDPAQNPTQWEKTEFTYRDERTRTILLSSQVCNNPSPCNTAGGVSALLPTSIRKDSFEYDEEGRFKSMTNESFGGVGVPLTGTPNSKTMCTATYEITSKSPMAHEHPMKFETNLAWDNIDFSDRDLIDKLECEVDSPQPAGPPLKQSVVLSFQWKRLYEILGVSPPR